MKNLATAICFAFCPICLAICLDAMVCAQDVTVEMLQWSELESLPNELGVAGPFAGVHKDALIIAGGANFPIPIWESEKTWYEQIHVLERSAGKLTWHDGGKLPRATGYGAAVATPDGVVCIGGNDSQNTFADVYALVWDRGSKRVTRDDGYPDLPKPCAFTAATLVGNVIYVAGGQSGSSLATAMNNFWSLDLTKKDTPADFQWKQLDPWPGPTRALNLTIGQHNGFDDSVYVISGRREQAGQPQFLTDCWEYSIARNVWRKRSDSPQCLMAGTSIALGQSHVFVLGGADGTNFHHGASLGEDHPGFPKKSFAYHTITDTWIQSGTLPENHVTTIAVKWGDQIIVPSGEVKPKVRSPKIWSVWPVQSDHGFGAVNYIVLFGYLFAMVGVGVYCAKRNDSTEQFFRGSKNIPWWAAGCSIFATMLSSLTYTGVPSKAFAQDWVYAVGNMMIPVVAFIAVFIALPFFRRIDATSAYEYLEHRFDRSVRWFGSLSFTLFHIFRMAVVMALTGLALAVATPLTPAQSVLLMGVLSIIYCTIGGIEAVIWTDTIQTVVLLGGAIIALAMLISGVEGGFGGFVDLGSSASKFNFSNLHWDAADAQVALWVILVGGIGQNVSSYTADQAVVQRYMTTADQRLAARSIWVNALLVIPATALFFAIGTALFAYYHSHPEKLDPSSTTDQVFPLFIAKEMPIGVAGLLVAGIFAAAQSTVSTSMNSTATALVTDFLKPLRLCRDDKSALRAGKILTIVLGVFGTAIGLMFVNPEIRSLFDQFLRVIGMFMGVLGGLFVLGVMTRSANASGALFGAGVGAGVMFALWKSSAVHGYLYTSVGIATCFIVGLTASQFLGKRKQNIDGLTIYTMSK